MCDQGLGVQMLKKKRMLTTLQLTVKIQHQFSNKAALIHFELNAVVDTGPVGVSLVSICPLRMVTFQFVLSEDVNRILRGVKATVCVLSLSFLAYKNSLSG